MRNVVIDAAKAQRYEEALEAIRDRNPRRPGNPANFPNDPWQQLLASGSPHEIATAALKDAAALPPESQDDLLPAIERCRGGEGDLEDYRAAFAFADDCIGGLRAKLNALRESQEGER